MSLLEAQTLVFDGNINRSWGGGGGWIQLERGTRTHLANTIKVAQGG